MNNGIKSTEQGLTSLASGTAPVAAGTGGATPAAGSGGGGALGAAATGSAAPSPQVQITSTASQLAALEQSLQAQPEVDAERVRRVQSALADGSYRLDPSRIAGGLLQSEQTLATL